MPDMSNIDSEKILSTVNQLEGITDRIGGCVSKITDALMTLDNGWVSEVKADFMKSYENDHLALQEMMGQLTELNMMLREAASDFDKTENEMISGVNSLR